jgi:outer membrane biosynthesis protein TonB
MNLRTKFGIFFLPEDLDSPWRSPINLSIGLHLLVLAAALVMPSLMEHRPRLPEFYTVNLINVTEVSVPAVPAPPAPIQPATPTKAEKEVAPPHAISEQRIATAVSETVQPISINPVKHKIRRAEEKEEQQLEKTRQALLEERKRTEQALMESKAKAARLAEEAVDKLRRSLQTGAMVSPQPAAREGAGEKASVAAAGPAGTGISVDEPMGRYLAAVYQRIQSHWYIPPLQNWEDSLEAVLVIQVSRNGTLTKTFFEKKSANLYFNQFVYKTVQESAPLPPFPGELDKKDMEIGLRFSPAGVY